MTSQEHVEDWTSLDQLDMERKKEHVEYWTSLDQIEMGRKKNNNNKQKTDRWPSKNRDSLTKQLIIPPFLSSIA